MQKFFAIILIIGLLGQTFGQAWYHLDYMIQQKEYIKRCENKTRPQLHCDGKCQLMKKLEAFEKKQEGSAPELKLAAKAEVLSSKSFFDILYTHFTTNQANSFAVFNINTIIDQPSSFFHPPSVIA